MQVLQLVRRCLWNQMPAKNQAVPECLAVHGPEPPADCQQHQPGQWQFHGPCGIPIAAEAPASQIPAGPNTLLKSSSERSCIECRALVAVLLACVVGSAVCAPAPLCAGAGDDDPRAARFCQALNTFLELYAEAAGEQVPEYQGQFQALVRDYPQLLDTGMKRQDVVHSFLRFGRRR